MMNKKAQLFAMDLVVSIVILVIIYLFLFGLWNLYSNQLEQKLNDEEMNLLAFQVSDALFKTKGLPENWATAPEDALSPGLLSYPGNLLEEKVDAFVSLDYDNSRKMFNLERYEYYFEIQDLQGNTLQSSGIETGSDTKSSVSLVNFAKIQNDTRRITFTLWQ